MFEKNQTIKELNIDPTKRFRVVDDNGNSNVTKGDILELFKDNGGIDAHFNNLTRGTKDFNCYLYRLEYADKDWDNLCVGDELKDSVGYSQFVLGVCGRAIFLSEFGDKDFYNCGYTKEELIEKGYTIVQDTKDRTVDDILEGLPEADKSIIKKALK